MDPINDPHRTSEERLNAARALRDTSAPDLRAVCEVDLHIHSFCSDGYHAPAGRVFEAWRRRMKAISLTDHDNFDGVAEAIEAGRIFGIDVVPGIEFYTDRPGVEIIAYWPLVDRFLAWLEADGGREVIEPIRAAKGKQLADMVERVPACMARRGLEAEITPEDIETFVRNGISTKGDISVILWQKYGPQLAARGIAADVKEVQATYTTQDDELNVPLEIDLDLSPEAFVRRVRAWGGLPGISHPTELRKKEGLDNAALEAVVEALGALGLQCLEVDGWRNSTCPETGCPQTEVFVEILEAYNRRHPERPGLLPTNGSDDHNQPGEGLALGCGKDDNLRPAYGSMARVEALQERARLLAERDGPHPAARADRSANGRSV